MKALSQSLRAPTFVLILAAFVTAGCGSRHEVSYHYEILKKETVGSSNVVGSGKSLHTKAGDSWTYEFNQVGRIIADTKSLSTDRANIRVTWPDSSTTDFELAAKETKEEWHSSGDYGIRITMDPILAK